MNTAQTLRNIADELQARVDGGDFALCFAHVQADMATLLAKLHELADDHARMRAALADVLALTGDDDGATVAVAVPHELLARIRVASTLHRENIA